MQLTNAPEITNELERIGAKYGEISLELPQNLSKQDWASIGHRLCSCHQAAQWWIADWVAYGHTKYGDIKLFAEMSGYTPDSLYQMGWTAQRVKPFSRLKDLSFGHHTAVAKLSDKQQGHWLEKAKKEGLPRSALRTALLVAGAKENAKESDGAGFQWPQDQPIPNVIAWMKRQPADFWTDNVKAWWKEYLKPLVEIYEKL